MHYSFEGMENKVYSYKYQHPAVATDCVVFGYDGKNLHVLLIERGIAPYKGSWALPGGFLKMNETVEECAQRELQEETNMSNIYLEQFHVFSAVDRDPRERILSVSFLALVQKSKFNLIAGDDATKAEWFEINNLPSLAFDHKEIIELAKNKLQQILSYKPIAFKLLDKTFIMSELQRLYELINETEYDRRNFHKKMIATGLFKNEGICKIPMHGRSPKMYTFNEERYNELVKNKTIKKYPFDF